MDADSVVVKLNVLVDRIIRLLASFKPCLVHEFFLNDAVKCLNTSVIVAVAFAAHATSHLVLTQPFTVLCRSVLRPTIGMVD